MFDVKLSPRSELGGAEGQIGWGRGRAWAQAGEPGEPGERASTRARLDRASTSSPVRPPQATLKTPITTEPDGSDRTAHVETARHRRLSDQVNGAARSSLNSALPRPLPTALLSYLSHRATAAPPCQPSPQMFLNNFSMCTIFTRYLFLYLSAAWA